MKGWRLVKSLIEVVAHVLCCKFIIDPMVVVLYSTILANTAGMITCVCIWLIIFVDVSMQLFVAAEAAYHELNSYIYHVIVTLTLLPTFLMYWTFAMWYIMSRLIEWIYLVWSTPVCYTSRQHYATSAEKHIQLEQPLLDNDSDHDIECAEEDSQSKTPVAVDTFIAAFNRAKHINRKAEWREWTMDR